MERLAPQILLTAAMPSTVSIEDRFAVHRLWETADPEAFFSEFGQHVLGIAAAGHIRIDDEFMARLPNLEIIANFGVGYDRIDVASARRRGIIVTNTPDVLTEEVADLALGLLIATARSLPQADRFVRAGRWPSGNFPLSASLRDRRIGIVGLGRIGRAVARRCVAMGLDVCYFGRARQPDVPYPYFEALLDLATAVDALIITVPGGADTDGLVGAEILDALGSDGILVNVARGSVVDESALVKALQEGRILAAGLDVYRNEPHVPNELLDLENVVLLPHVGSASRMTREAMGQMVVDNLTSWFRREGPLTPVPETPWGRDPGAQPREAGVDQSSGGPRIMNRSG